MLVCLVFSVAETNHWSHREARVSGHNHTAGSVTAGFGKRCFEATRWCLLKLQVHKRHIKMLRHFTTRSQAAAQFAIEPPNPWIAFVLNDQAVQSPHDVLLGGKVWPPQPSWRSADVSPDTWRRCCRNMSPQTTDVELLVPEEEKSQEPPQSFIC